MTGKRKIVDVHLHLYDHTQNRHEFLESEDKMFRALVGDYSSLPRTYLLDDYLADASDVEIEGLVWNEFLSTDPVKEIRWAQNLAGRLPVPVALVGLVDLLAPDLEKTLDTYSQCSRVVAVRQHFGWDETNPLRRFAARGDLLIDPRLFQGLKTLVKYPFKCSLEMFAPQLNDLRVVAEKNPGISFWIPVIGWPLDLSKTGFAQWKQDLEALSALSNVHVAISALECVFGMDWTVADAASWVKTLFDLFGAGRIMFGSHRPLCKLSRSFPNPFRAYERFVASLSPSEQDAVFRKNAAAWFFDGTTPRRRNEASSEASGRGREQAPGFG
jgi:predicted TIM-barrel fold metal-dependent hydrolase